MPMKQRLGRWNERIWESAPGQVIARIGENDVMSLAAALSYYTLISLAPTVMLLLWISTTLYPDARESFFEQLQVLAGPQVEAAARTVVENADRHPGVGSMAAAFGTAASILGASIVFAQLQLALNRIFGTPSLAAKGIVPWLRKRLFAAGMVVSLGFLLVVSMIAQAGLELVAQHISAVLPVVVTLLSLVLYTLVFAAIYHWVPDCPIDGRRALIGGALTAGLFIVGRVLIGLYLGRASLGSAYGPAGGLVVMLIWIYYSAVVFFIGAIATSVMDDRARGDRRHGNELRDDAEEPGDDGSDSGTPDDGSGSGKPDDGKPDEDRSR